MSDFLKSNQQLDEAITSADNFEAMREAMLQTLAAQGQVARSRTDAYDVRVIPQAPTLPAPRLDDEKRDSRPINAERVLYLSGNSRIVITSADGEAALDAMEQRLRATFAAQR